MHHNKADIEYAAGRRPAMEEWPDEPEKDRLDAYAADQRLVRNGRNPSQGLWPAVGVPVWRYKHSRCGQSCIFGGFAIRGCP